MTNILIAAKSDPVRRALCGMLRAAGYQVTEAVDGGDALCIVQSESIDLLLTDLRLPVMDGLALSLAAKRECNALKVLVMSEDALIAGTLRALDVKIDGIIMKPFDSHALTSEIVRIVPGRVPAKRGRAA